MLIGDASRSLSSDIVYCEICSCSGRTAVPMSSVKRRPPRVELVLVQQPTDCTGQTETSDFQTFK